MTASPARVPRLMLVTDRHRSARPLPDLVAAAVAGGVDAVQLRESDLPPAELLNLANRLREVVAGRAALLVNGDARLAADLGLGLHLPERGLATAEARRLLGADRLLLGRSVHSPAAAAAAAGADYLLAGHVFATAAKPDRPPLGLAGLGQIVAATWAPVLAIGGITPDRVAEVMATGATGVAVIGAIAEAPDPERAAAALRQAVDANMEDEMDATPQSVVISVNGKPVEVEPDTTVTDFLADKGLRGAMAIVELNGAILARRAYDSTVFAPGDQVEVVHAVGGG